ncbi:MAG: thiamine phosphate synthase [Lysobacterales bacterium]
MTRSPLLVVAGILRDSQGRVLLCQRPAGRSQAGLWEFPGGKREPGEDSRQALARELHEELGIQVLDAQPLCSIRHDYPDISIRLEAWQVSRWRGEPTGHDGQAWRWLWPWQVHDHPLAEADRPLANALLLPASYAITPEPAGIDRRRFLAGIEHLLAAGHLLQLRSKKLPSQELTVLAQQAGDLAQERGGDLLLNDQPALAARLGLGLHLPSARLRQWAGGHHDAADEPWLPRASDGRLGLPDADAVPAWPRSRQARGWLAASCHNAEELAMAARLGCDFATVSPVAATASHPDARPLGWPGLADLIADSRLPVYALGGLGSDDIGSARDLGALGVAAIRAFWPAAVAS